MKSLLFQYVAVAQALWLVPGILTMINATSLLNSKNKTMYILVCLFVLSKYAVTLEVSTKQL